MPSRMKLPLRFDVIANRVEAKDCSDLSSTVNSQPPQSDQSQSLEDLLCIEVRIVHIGCSLSVVALQLSQAPDPIAAAVDVARPPHEGDRHDSIPRSDC